MYLNKDKMEAIFEQFKGNLIGEFDEKHKFLVSLLQNDDWSLVIKGHALIESVITELIMESINEKSLKTIVERLPLHDSQASKLKILKIYDKTSEKESFFIRKFSELRNQLVHKFENVDFKFDQFVNKLDKNQKKSWAKAFAWHANDQEAVDFCYKEALENPKFAVWLSILLFVLHKAIVIEQQKTLNFTKEESINDMAKIISKINVK